MPASFDLSSYVRIGRYDLPEPTRTAAPDHNLLAQEASGVTYDWDTGTLFVVGDGGTSVTQVSITGQLIDTMTLAQGGSPQGTEFYDPEGITYVGGGKFVFTEERDRQVVRALTRLRAMAKRGKRAPREIHDPSHLIHELRLFKKGPELEMLRRAISVSADGHVRAMQATRPGRGEWEVQSINNGEADLPYIALEPIAVTKDNIEETVIADGFRTWDEVCTGEYEQYCPADR